MSLSIARPELTERRGARSDRLPLVSGGATYALLAVLCTLGAYWLLFSQFAVFDDEGFFDYSLKLFMAGHPLYSSDFSVYGPFYYELFGTVFALLGTSVTTDTGRLIELVIWLLASFGLGFTAHRLTGRLSLGVAALGLAFFLLSAMSAEPMHPEALICALLISMAGVTAFALPHRPRTALTALGALTGALLLTKVNAGGFALISIVFAVIMSGASLYRHAILRWAGIAALVLVTPAVMAPNLNTTWAQMYAVLVVLSALALALIATPVAHDSAPDESAWWAQWLIGGFAGMTILVLIIVFALGTSPAALISQIIVVPASKQGGALTVPLTLTGAAIWWSLGSVAVAWTLRRTGLLRVGVGGASASAWPGVLRTVAGVAILLSLGNQFPFEIYPKAAFALAMPLTWVAALPSRRDLFGPRGRLIRLLIPSVALLQGLVAYPVAGAQVGLSSILFVLCGVICLADGWADLVAWTAARNTSGLLADTGLTALFVALALGSVFQLVIQPMSAWQTQYRAGTPLRISGATLLRLAPAQAQTLDSIVRTVPEHCGTLMELPGLYSFNLWTGLPTPTPLTGEQPWWAFLSPAQQRANLAAAKSSLGLCAIQDDAAANYNGMPPPHVPLIRFIEDDFITFASKPPYLVELAR